jgi:hypothetical protein
VNEPIGKKIFYLIDRIESGFFRRVAATPAFIGGQAVSGVALAKRGFPILALQSQALAARL